MLELLSSETPDLVQSDRRLLMLMQPEDKYITSSVATVKEDRRHLFSFTIESSNESENEDQRMRWTSKGRSSLG